MTRLDRLIVASAAEWGVPPRLARWLFWLPVAGALALPLLRLNKDAYRFVLGEDGPVEWVQFAVFALACVVAVAVSARLRAERRLLGAGLYAIAALGLFFVAGEEISWGQRLLGFQTPAELAVINKQNEVTIHNIGSTLIVLNLAMMLMGAWGAVAFPASKRLRLGRWLGETEWLVVPPFFVAGAFAVIFLYKLIRFTVWVPSGFTITKYGEWAELSLAYAIFVFVCLIHRRLAHGALEAAPARPTNGRIPV